MEKNNFLSVLASRDDTPHRILNLPILRENIRDDLMNISKSNHHLQCRGNCKIFLRYFRSVFIFKLSRNSILWRSCADCNTSKQHGKLNCHHKSLTRTELAFHERFSFPRFPELSTSYYSGAVGYRVSSCNDINPKVSAFVSIPLLQIIEVNIWRESAENDLLSPSEPNVKNSQ